MRAQYAALPPQCRAYNIASAGVVHGIGSWRPKVQRNGARASAAIIRMYFLYSTLTALAMVLLSPYFLIRSLQGKGYLQNLPERLGLKFPPELAHFASSPGAIWIHSVSV